jgi:4-alpha-glucanotransferase
MPLIRFEPAASLEESHLKAADASGVSRDYWDVFHRRHEISIPARRKILEALGWPVDDLETMERHRMQRFESAYARPLPKTLVVSVREIVMPITLDTRAAGRIRWSLHLEQGETRSGEFDTPYLPVLHQVQMHDRTWTTYAIHFPSQVPLGYHRFTAALDAQLLGETHLVICPDQAYLPEWIENGGRTAGFSVSLYGLRSDRNWGCGDFTDLRTLIDWARHDVGFSFIGLNPLHAIHNRTPYNTSPYLPNSIYYKNWIYIDVERVPEFAQSRCVQSLVRSAKLQKTLAELRDADFVQYEKVASLKKSYLRLLYREFRRNRALQPERARAFDDYCRQEGDLLDSFALYCALDEVLHKRDRNVWTWQQWPAEYQDRRSPGCAQFAREYARTIEFHKYLQFELQQQLDAASRYAKEIGMPIGLYHDLAVATDNCGSDLWAHRNFYVQGCRVGAPPDEFSPYGQDWAFPPPNTQAHREDGYRLFRESIRKIVRSGGALRLDHVMRLFRLFWIPEGFSALEGTYVYDYVTDLLHILSLESVRSSNIVIGEDLGTVTDEMRATLAQFRILSYRLFWFEKRSDGAFKRSYEYPRQALVASSTHDLPTLAGFWAGRDIEARKAAGLVDEANYWHQLEGRVREKQNILDVLHEEGLLPAGYPRNAAHLPEVDGTLHNAVIGFIAQMPSMILLLSSEDFTKEEDQQNLPGSTSEYPNWQHKMKAKLEDLRSPRWQPFTAMFRHQLERTGRL